MIKDQFKHLFLLGRPAAGKSEFIDFIKSMPLPERMKTCHIGKFEEIDDFPWIWEKFMEDDLWEKAGYPRKYSAHYMEGNPGMTPEGSGLFDLCMEKFNSTITEKYLSHPDFYTENTLIIEFARGRKGFREAFQRLAPDILRDSAVLYIKVGTDESWRRNIARYQEKQKHSILAHMVPKETFDYHYRRSDWESLTGGAESGHISTYAVETGFHRVGGKGRIRIPFVSMNNEPELPPGPEIAKRYKTALDQLWNLVSDTSGV